MQKINFTEEHLQKLRSLIADYVLEDKKITGKFGDTYGVSELMVQSISSLNELYSLAKKRYESYSTPNSEWIAPNDDVCTIHRNDMEFISLIIGYKLKQVELKEIEDKKSELQSKIDTLKESMKSPSERLEELEAELNAI